MIENNWILSFSVALPEAKGRLGHGGIYLSEITEKTPQYHFECDHGVSFSKPKTNMTRIKQWGDLVMTHDGIASNKKKGIYEIAEKTPQHHLYITVVSDSAKPTNTARTMSAVITLLIVRPSPSTWLAVTGSHDSQLTSLAFNTWFR